MFLIFISTCLLLSACDGCDETPLTKPDATSDASVDFAKSDTAVLDTSSTDTGTDTGPNIDSVHVCQDGVLSDGEDKIDCGGICLPCGADFKAGGPIGIVDILAHVIEAQPGQTPGALELDRLAYFRGRVIDPAGRGISDAKIAVQSQDDVGYAMSNSEGFFELVFNGGGELVFNVSAGDYLPIQRKNVVRWNAFLEFDDIVLTPLDDKVSEFSTNLATPQMHLASAVNDERGTRQASLLFKPNTNAKMVMPDGSEVVLDTMKVRVTEYTVGDRGPAAMPGPITPGIAYTYAAELSLDEAIEVGATSVLFNKPVAMHLENFLNADVGTLVPVGSYDREKAQWIPDPDGRTLGVVSISNALADVDLNGDGNANPELYEKYFLDEVERTAIAERFKEGESFWRILRTHFTPMDYNYAIEVLDGKYGFTGFNRTNDSEDNPCTKNGSIIECQNLTLGESIPIAGAGTLNYRSNRVPGYRVHDEIVIPIIDEEIPFLQDVLLVVNVAGHRVQKRFTNAANQTFTYKWEKKDGFGRELLNVQTADVSVFYNYLVPGRLCLGAGDIQRNSFGEVIGVSGCAASRRVMLFRSVKESSTFQVGSADGRTFGFGGWTHSFQHVLNRSNSSLLFGGGGAQTMPSESYNVAIKKNVSWAALPNGMLVADTTKIGTGVKRPELRYFKDGKQIKTVEIDFPMGVNPWRGPVLSSVNNGALLAYMYGGSECKAGSSGCGGLYRIDSSGRAEFVLRWDSVDDCLEDFPCGDGESALDAKFHYIRDKFVEGPDGSIYFVEGLPNSDPEKDGTYYLRQIRPDGTLRTLSGKVGDFVEGGNIETSRIPDSLLSYSSLGVDAKGRVYLAFPVRDGFDSVWRLELDGTTHKIAGGSDPYRPHISPQDFEMKISETVVSPSGSVFIGLWGSTAILEIADDEMKIIYGDLMDQAPDRESKALKIGPNESLVMNISGVYHSKKIVILKGTNAPSSFPNPQTNELFEFDDSGRHMFTKDLKTSEVIRSFEYNADGFLIKITSTTGEISFERSPDNALISITGEGGQRTEIALDGGWLSEIKNPVGKTNSFEYGPEGLMTKYIDSAGRQTQFEYLPKGQLEKDIAPDGGTQVLRREVIENGYEVVHKSALGFETTYRVENLEDGKKNTRLLPTGAQIVTTKKGNFTKRQSANGMVDTQEAFPHPIWKFSYARKSTTTTPLGLKKVVQKTISAAPSATPSADYPDNLSTLNTIINTNGRDVYEDWTFLPNGIEIRNRLASGFVFEQLLDKEGRLTRWKSPGLAPRLFSHNAANGDLERFSVHDQQFDLGRNIQGQLISRKNILGEEEVWTYDQSGVLESWSNANNETYTYPQNVAGESSGMTTPMGESFILDYDVNGFASEMTIPRIGRFVWVQDMDKKRTEQIFPSGRKFTEKYDTTGRNIGWDSSSSSVALTYHGVSDQIKTMTSQPMIGNAQTLGFDYDGALPTELEFSGEATATFNFEYTQAHQIRRVLQSMGGENRALEIVRNQNGLLSKLGALNIGYSDQISPNRFTRASMVTEFTNDALGRPQLTRHVFNGIELFSQERGFDASGRLATMKEKIEGVEKSYAYRYDNAGQLIGVSDEGAILEDYQYDADGNRTSSLRGLSVYEGHLLKSFEGKTTTIDGDGFIVTLDNKTLAYNTKHELLSVVGPFGTIEYQYDGLGRRISRKFGAEKTTYTYGNPGRQYEISGVTRPDGTQVWFDYTPSGQLIAMTVGGVQYDVISDPKGSPRLVVDSSGTIVKDVRRDSFGVLLQDSDPAFLIEIGYAGGLQDELTDLVRFWHRDYHTQSGRWTALDPVFFSGDKRNLYIYAENNPVSNVDPTGLWCLGVSTYLGFGGGLKYCSKDGKQSFCAEVGFGSGGGVSVSPLGGTDSSGQNIMLGFSAGIGVASVGAELKLTSCGDLERKAEFTQLGRTLASSSVAGGRQKGSGKIAIEKISLVPTKLGATAKLSGEVCREW